PLGNILNLNNSISKSNRARLATSLNLSPFNKDNLTMIVGGEVYENHSEGNGRTIYGYNPDLGLSIPVNFTASFPLFLGGSSTIPNNQTFTESNRRQVSFFGNISYSVADKYIFSGSFRRDASNLFGVKTNERWNPLWSLGF